ncbi:MAG TPA: VOC family protein [Kofleriaceae bacterium]|nr:VOC family protein [Kofleriaceae bacterium]
MIQQPRFVWHDLNTTDSAAAQRFYGELFHWTFKADGPYAHIQAGDQMIGGVRAIGPGEPTPPSWLGYVGVGDVAATADKMAAAGGTILVPTTEIPNAGTFAVVADPSGAVLAPWKSARPGDDAEPAGLPATYTFCWDELASTNLDAATKFYTATLGWAATQIDMGGGMTYTLLKRPGVKDPTMPGEDRNAGGAMPSPPGVPYSYWLAYVAVPSTDAAIDTVTRLGGRVVAPAMDIPNVGRIAVFQDPQGATLAVLQPASM